MHASPITAETPGEKLVKYRLHYLALAISLPVSAQEADYELVTISIHTIRAETALPVTGLMCVGIQ